MKRSINPTSKSKGTWIIFIVALLVILSLIGCQGAKETPDTAATVSAAVNATGVAQANAQATIDAAVKATTAAQPTAAGVATPTSTAAPTQKSATPKPAGPSATPAPTVNYVAMTEEDLAALIDQSVQEAVAATTTATTQTTSATADGTLTTQEVQALLTASTTSQAEINQALTLAQEYYDLYADVSSETLATLQAIEQDLNSMSQSMAQMTQILSQGQATVRAALTQLQSAATKASSTAQNVQTKAKSWDSSAKAEINTRAANALNVKPTNVPTDLKGTAQSVTTYLDTVRSAVSDNKVTKTELNAISLAGANAVAGLNANGGAQFQGAFWIDQQRDQANCAGADAERQSQSRCFGPIVEIVSRGWFAPIQSAAIAWRRAEETVMALVLNHQDAKPQRNGWVIELPSRFN